MEAKVKAHQQYDAAFVRAADHDGPSPEEIARQQQRKKRLVRGALGVLVVCLVGAAISAVFWLRRDTPERQFARAQEYARTNSHLAAIIELKRSLQADTEQPKARVLLGQELSLLNDPKGAEIEFRKALDAKYEPDTTMPLLATSLLHQAKFAKVIELVNDASIDSPEANAALLAMRGSSYFALGREAEAANSWKAAKEFVPDHPATLLAEARAKASRGAYDDAARSIEHVPEGVLTTEVFTLRGDLARATGKPEEAITDYETALKNEPSNLLVRTNLAQTLVELSRYDEAKVQARKVLGAMPNYPNALYITALAAVGKKDYVAADDAIERALAVQPADGRFQLLAGTLALQLGRNSEAEVHLKDAVTLMPTNVDARRLLTMLYMSRHDVQKADDLFNPVFNAARDRQDVASVAARIALLQGNGKRAAKAFDDVDPSDPRNLESTLLAASLRMKTGDKAGGFAKLQTAARAMPDNPDVDAALVMAHLTFRENKEAAASWAELARKEPGSARTANLGAAVDLARGDKVAARAALEQSVAADPHFLAPVSGLAMLDVGDQRVDDATARLQKYLADNPTDVDAVMLFVQLERSTANRPAVILDALQKARLASPRSARIVTALVAFYVSQQDLKQAVSTAEDGLKFAPREVPLQRFVGDQALASGDADRAIAVFSQLSAENAESPIFPIRLGQADLAAGRYEEALSNFRLALSRQPNDPNLQATMVGSLLAAGRPDEAGRMLFEVTRMSPVSPAIGELDADVKLGKKQFPEAVAAYRKALADTPNSRLAIKTAQALTTARLRGEASTFLADWLKGHPGDEVVRLYDADMAMKQKDYARAAGNFRIVASAHPKDALVLNNLAWNLARLDDPQALPTAEKASALAPDNAAISDTLGWMLVEKGQADRGLALIEKASAAAPNELEIRLHLARAQLKTGKAAAARATLQQLIATAPESQEGRQARDLIATF